MYCDERLSSSTYALILGSFWQTETYVDKFPHLQCQPLHRVSHFNSIGIARTVFFSVSRNRIRMYPSLVNCTTIDLFADWPQDALLEVGERYLSQIDLAGDDKVNNFPK
jgi:hypothetical protein